MGLRAPLGVQILQVGLVAERAAAAVAFVGDLLDLVVVAAAP